MQLFIDYTEGTKEDGQLMFSVTVPLAFLSSHFFSVFLKSFFIDCLLCLEYPYSISPFNKFLFIF